MTPAREDVFYAAIALSRTAMIVTDPELPDNPIVYANPAFLELFGGAAQDVLGKNPRFMRSERADALAIERLRRAVAARETVNVDILNRRLDGSEFLSAVLIAPVLDEDGELLYFLGSQSEVLGSRSATEIEGEWKRALQLLQKQAQTRERVVKALRRADEALVEVLDGSMPLAEGIAEARVGLASALASLAEEGQ